VGRTYRIPVLANDSDPDGDQLTLVKVGKAKHGTARRSGGKVVYRAPTSWTGTTTVSYTVRDPAGATATGTLSITIQRRTPAVKPKPKPKPTAPAAGQGPSKAAVESALARLGLPTGSADGRYDARTRRAVCAWRTVTGRPVTRSAPSPAEAEAIVAMGGLPAAQGSMVTGVNVSVTCQAAFWVGANREYRRVMAASSGKPGYRTRSGTHQIFRTHAVWRFSTIYPEARMYKPMQFSGGQALHGSATDSLVKTYPASHGCVRMLHRDIDAMQAGGVGNGTLVRVFGAW
jgi:peptidoglycan hydrolase-like protein with peptidoglycan-binding domain